MSNYREEYEIVTNSSGRKNNNRWLKKSGVDVETVGHHLKHEGDLTDGLLTYLPMYDDNSGYDVEDKTGNLNVKSGRITSLLSSDGRVTKGFSFNGSLNDYLDLDGIEENSGDVFDFNKRFTIQAWIKLSDLVTTKYIFATTGDTSTSGFIVGVDNQKPFVQVVSDSSNYYYYRTLENKITSVNEWYHIVFEYNGRFSEAVEGQDQWTVYLNGESVFMDYISASSAGTSIIFPSSTYRVSYFDTFTANDFNGKMCEFGIWNRVLYPYEILALYNGGKGLHYDYFKNARNEAFIEGVYSSDNSAGSNNLSSVLAAYKFDENNASSQVTDYSGNGLHGTIASATNSSLYSSNYSMRHPEGYFITSTSSSEDITVPLHSYIDINKAFSMNIWVYYASAAYMFGSDTTVGTANFAFFMSSSNVLVRAYDGSGNYTLLQGSQSVPSDRRWNMITFTYDGSGNFVDGSNIYVNGINYGLSSTVSGTLGSFSPAAVTVLSLGYGGLRSATIYDDFYFWDSEISHSDVVALYNDGEALFIDEFPTEYADEKYKSVDLLKGMIDCYTLGDNSNSTVVESYLGRTDGVCTSNTSSIRSEYGCIDESLTLGTADNVKFSLENSSGEYFSSKKAFSFSIWINGTFLTTTSHIINNSEATAKGFQLFASGSKLYLRLIYSAAEYRTYLTGTISADSDYHHIAVSYSGVPHSDSVKIYYDGESLDLTLSVNGGPANDIESTQPVCIGQQGASGTASLIDSNYQNFIAWSRKITQSEVLYLYNNGFGRKLSEIVTKDRTNDYVTRLFYDRTKNNLLAYYKMNDNRLVQTNVCHDYSGNGKDGVYTMGSGSLGLDSPIGLSLSCDGTNDIYVTSDVEDFTGQYISASKPFSFSMWFKDSSTTGAYRTLFSTNQGTNPNWVGMTLVVQSGTVTLYVDDGSNHSYIQNYFSVGSDSGRWYNLLVTYDGLGLSRTSGYYLMDSFSLYVNGMNTLFKIGAYSGWSDFATGEPMSIGYATIPRGAASRYNAPITEFMFWNKCLCKNEAAMLYNNGTPLNFQVGLDKYLERPLEENNHTNIIETIRAYDEFTPDSDRGRSTDVIVNRFGGNMDKNSSVGALDRESLEFSPYNSINYRNLKSRKLLDEEWSR